MTHTANSPGKQLNGRYLLLCRLGSQVWRAQDQELGRTVALEDLASVQAGDPPGRARQVARAMARVSHSSVVPIHDVIFDGDGPWIVMDDIQGRPLDDERPPIDDQEAARVGLSLVSGLSALHAVDVVHHDVKPENILIREDRTVCLVNFTASEIIGAEEPLTRPGAIMGTPRWLAPERLLGQRVDPSEDVWSLGATLFWCLEGSSPYEWGSRGEYDALAQMKAVSAILEGRLQMTRQGRLPDLVARLLAPQPHQRPGLHEIAGHLRQILGKSGS